MFDSKNNLMKTLEESIKVGADMIILKPNLETLLTDTHLYICNNDSTPTKLDYDCSFNLGKFENISIEIADISFSTSELESYLNKNILGDQNILINSNTKHLYLGRITKNSNTLTKEHSIQIYIKKTEFSSIFDFLTISNSLQGLSDKIQKETPIILFNKTSKLNRLILSTIFQETTQIDLFSISSNFTSLLKTSNHPILISHNFEDPVDALFAFNETVKKLNIENVAIEKLYASLVFKPLKKQCGICSKPTVISGETREKFPRHYKAQIPTVYQFSRGCQNCGYTSFMGLMTIESIFVVPNYLKTKLKETNDPSLAYTVYRELKIKTIFEDAIEKICNGDISVDEVSNHLPQISNAFSEFLDGNLNNTNFTPGVAKILIIEDDINQREVLELVFKKEGYQVFSAENGKVAIENLKKNEISVIVSDIMMPEMNGLEFLKFCKSSTDFKQIPILMITASSNPDHELTMLEEGADDYCPKNSKKKVILKRVEKLVNKNIVSANPLKHLIQD